MSDENTQDPQKKASTKTPVEETPVAEEAKTDEAPEKAPEAEAAPEEKPAQETPSEEIEVETPAEEALADMPADEVSAAQAETAEETPTKETPTSTEPAYKTKLVDFTELKTGQTIRLHERIQDVSPKGEPRERVQIFEGIILQFGGSGITRTVTLRKISKGFAVEKIYPINSPIIAKIELVKSAKVRRAKLNYLKNPKRRFKRKLKETLIAVVGGKKRKKKKK